MTMEAMLVLVLLGALAFGPLAWRLWRDRGEARALTVRADVHRALTRALQGESLVSVEVTPAGPFRAGRVLLSAPADWAWLVEEALDSVLTHTPPDYELVIKTGQRRSFSSTGRRTDIPRAA